MTAGINNISFRSVPQQLDIHFQRIHQVAPPCLTLALYIPRHKTADRGRSLLPTIALFLIKYRHDGW